LKKSILWCTVRKTSNCDTFLQIDWRNCVST